MRGWTGKVRVSLILLLLLLLLLLLESVCRSCRNNWDWTLDCRNGPRRLG